MSMMFRTITSYSSPINNALSAWWLAGVTVTDGKDGDVADWTFCCVLSVGLDGAVVWVDRAVLGALYSEIFF